MDGNPVQPRFQAAFAVKTLNATKYLEKDFLCSVGRIGRIGQDAINKAVNRLVIMRNQPAVGLDQRPDLSSSTMEASCARTAMAPAMLPTAAAAPAILLMASPQRYQEYGAATTFSPFCTA